jgi:hypothetical protein
MPQEVVQELVLATGQVLVEEMVALAVVAEDLETSREEDSQEELVDLQAEVDKQHRVLEVMVTVETMPEAAAEAAVAEE